MIDALNAEHAKLEEAYDGADELPDEVDERLGEIEAALAAFDNRPVTYDPADIARAGVFVSIDAERRPVGPPRLCPAAGRGARGRAGGRTARPIPRWPGRTAPIPTRPVIQRAVITIGGQIAGSEDEDDEDLKPLPDRLVTELTAERTLRCATSWRTRPPWRSRPCCTSSASMSSPAISPTGRRWRCRSAAPASRYRHRAEGHACSEGHRRRVTRSGKSGCPRTRPISGTGSPPSPARSRQRFSPTAPLSASMRSTRRATATARAFSSHTSSSAIAEGRSPSPGRRSRLVQAGWRPTVENFLGRVPKLRILEAVQEGAGERAAQLIDHLKKGDMAKEAERLLADTGWLPEPLRIAAVDDAPVEAPKPMTTAKHCRNSSRRRRGSGSRRAADDRGE